MTDFRKNYLMSVIKARDDVAAGRLTADAAFEQLIVAALHPADHAILQYVQERRSVNATDVAYHFSVTMVAATHALNRLVSAGLVRRIPDERPDRARNRYLFTVEGEDGKS